MPVVPFSARPRSESAAPAAAPVEVSSDEAPWLFMAAATMDAQGRLVQEVRLTTEGATPTKNLDGLRNEEQRTKEKLQKSREEFDREMQNMNDNTRKFYEENTPEMLGPELEELYKKNYGPRRPKQKPTDNGTPMS